jgi:hypothetical protein
METFNHQFVSARGNTVRVFRTTGMAKANGFVGRTGTTRVHAVVNGHVVEVSKCGETYKAASAVAAAGF